MVALTCSYNEPHSISLNEDNAVIMTAVTTTFLTLHCIMANLNVL